MQELTPEEYTLIRFFEQSVEKFPDRVYLWEKSSGANPYTGTPKQ